MNLDRPFRFKPLLRLNDWALQEALLALQKQRETVRSLDEAVAHADLEVRGWTRRINPGVDARLDRGTYALGSIQAEGWLRQVAKLKSRRAVEVATLEAIQGRLAELKRQRSVIERRRDAALQEHEAWIRNRAASDQDDLWLARRHG